MSVSKSRLYLSEPTNIGGPVTVGLRPHICDVTDEYMEPATVKSDNPCIRRFESLTDDYNLNIFVGNDEYKTTDQ
jgi:hypothetical protein